MCILHQKHAMFTLIISLMMPPPSIQVVSHNNRGLGPLFSPFDFGDWYRKEVILGPKGQKREGTRQEGEIATLGMLRGGNKNWQILFYFFVFVFVIIVITTDEVQKFEENTPLLCVSYKQ